MTEGEAVHLLARSIVIASELLLPVLIVSRVVGVAIRLVSTNAAVDPCNPVTQGRAEVCLSADTSGASH